MQTRQTPRSLLEPMHHAATQHVVATMDISGRVDEVVVISSMSPSNRPFDQIGVPITNKLCEQRCYTCNSIPSIGQYNVINTSAILILALSYLHFSVVRSDYAGIGSVVTLHARDQAVTDAASRIGCLWFRTNCSHHAIRHAVAEAMMSWVVSENEHA